MIFEVFSFRFQYLFNHSVHTAPGVWFFYVYSGELICPPLYVCFKVFYFNKFAPLPMDLLFYRPQLAAEPLKQSLLSLDLHQ